MEAPARRGSNAVRHHEKHDESAISGKRVESGGLILGRRFIRDYREQETEHPGSAAQESINSSRKAANSLRPPILEQTL
jgi:hypothetical protein